MDDVEKLKQRRALEEQKLKERQAKIELENKQLLERKQKEQTQQIQPVQQVQPVQEIQSVQQHNIEEEVDTEHPTSTMHSMGYDVQTVGYTNKQLKKQKYKNKIQKQRSSIIHEEEEEEDDDVEEDTSDEEESSSSSGLFKNFDGGFVIPMVIGALGIGIVLMVGYLVIAQVQEVLPEMTSTAVANISDVTSSMVGTQTTVFAGFGLISVGIIVMAAFGLVNIFKKCNPRL